MEQVELTESTTYVTVEGDGITLVEITETVESIEITAPGPAGPQGIQGPTGPQGAQGPQGPAGNSTIGGYGVSLTSATADDLLAFDGTTWVNRAQRAVSDGGNF